MIDLYKELRVTPIEKVLRHIYSRIGEYSLSISSKDSYIKFRDLYNKTKNPLDLFILISYSFNHQIRFNNSHKFNNPFGKNRSCYNSSIEFNLKSFISRLQQLNVELYSMNFEAFDLSFLRDNDFVYCDPPYLITTSTYNDGKRGFTGWSEREELRLLNKLDDLNRKGIRFALSNVLKHRGKTNSLLKEWISDSNYVLNNIKVDYSNSNYQIKRDNLTTIEVLITNYIPKTINMCEQLSLLA